MNNLRIVKNRGQISKLKGKYILTALDEEFGEAYAEIGIKQIIGYLIIKKRKD